MDQEGMPLVIMRSRRSFIILVWILSAYIAVAPASLAREPLMEIQTSANEGSRSETAEAMDGYLTFQVDFEAGITSYLEWIVRLIRVALRGAAIGYEGLSIKEDRVVFVVRDPARSEETAELLKRAL
jgi:hypothetical protein